MKYSSTSRLVNAIVFSILLLAFGALGDYFSFFVSPTYLNPLGEAQRFSGTYPYNFSLNFGMLGMAVAALSAYGLFLSIKALSDKKDIAVQKTFFIYIAISYVFAAWFALNALVFYRLIGQAQYVFWIVMFVIFLIASLVAGNVPLMKILDGKESNEILIILVEAGAALAFGYLCNTIPTYLVATISAANGSGYYANFTNQLLTNSILACVALCASIASVVFIKKGKKLGEILAGATLLPFSGMFLATAIFEIIYKGENKFSLQTQKANFGSWDYVVMCFVVATVLLAGAVIFLSSSLLPEKKKQA
ncbi:MAG: hypothetical protein J5627_02200 [Bacilli bacterium]|nr:hypothetical protein [Bacilli bacterium]